MEKLKYLTILEAPSGYGKTYYIKNLTLNLKKIEYIPFNPDYFFDNLKSLCHDNNIAYSNSLDIFDWYRAWKNYNGNFIFILDNFHLLLENKNIINFISFFINNPLGNLNLIILSRCKTNLPTQKLISENNCIYIFKEDLKLSLQNTKSILNNLPDKEIELIYHKYDGWPLGVSLYEKLCKQEINKENFDNLIHNSVMQLFSNLQEKLFYSDFHAFKEWFLEPECWNGVWKQEVIALIKNKPHYWIYLAGKEEKPKNALIFLEKALKIAEGMNLSQTMLNIMTRLAHLYSIIGNFSKLDEIMEKSSYYFLTGFKTDKIAFLYMQANRLRQLCKHNEAIEVLNSLLELEADQKDAFDLQTRAKVLLGLINYQMGNYKETKKYYNEVLLITQAENNNALNLEIQIMLAFLSALEGNKEHTLPENIIELIEQQPLRKQALMWLNLIFYFILGEKLDIKLGKEILSKIKYIAYYLGYDYLNPLINDIEARIWRYNKDYDKAINLHEIVLDELQENTFDYLHAKLNQILTLIRVSKTNKNEYISELENLLYKSNSFNTIGLSRQIQAILDELQPKENDIAEFLFIDNLKDPVNKEVLHIKTFGKFEVKIGSNYIKKWQRKKTKLLLMHLLLNKRGIHRETLADLLFMSDEIENPLKNLDVTVHGLRKILEPNRKTKESSFILFQDSCYSINWEYPFNIDFIELEDFYKNWQKNYKNNLTEAKKLSKNIIDIYTGTFLVEIDFADNWESERESFHRKFLSVSSWYVETLISERLFDDVEDIAENLIKNDSLDETPYIYLLKVAENKKDINYIKEIYNRFVNILKKELNTAPSKNFTGIYNTLLNNFIK